MASLAGLLKAVGLASSGGAAKRMVALGQVQVDGRDELRKTAQIRAGQVVAVHGARIRVRAHVAAEAATLPVEQPPEQSLEQSLERPDPTSKG